MSMSNPDLPPGQGQGEKPKLSPLAQTFELIGQTVAALKPGNPAMVLDEVMWSAAANLSMGEYAAMRRLKAERASGERWG